MPAETEGVAEAIQAAGAFVTTLVGLFGPEWTLAIVVFLVVAAAAFRIYNDWKKSKERDDLVAAMEAAVQRIANQERLWRIEDLLRKGWTNEQVEVLVVEGSPRNPKESREGQEAKARELIGRRERASVAGRAESSGSSK